VSNVEQEVVDLAADVQPLVQVDNLTKLFALPKRLLRPRGFIRAVDDVSVYLHHAETLGIVGETGSGKSTLGRCVLRLLRPDFGQIAFAGENITDLSEHALRPLRRRMQPIYQDPSTYLNPMLTVADIVAEGLEATHQARHAAARKRAFDWIRRVGLPKGAANRRPEELSAGERQRVAIARALAVEPQLIVCDEPLNALDVSVRAQIVNLLLDLQDEFSISYLFISHDLRIVRYVSHRIAVMYLGRVVETGSAEQVTTLAAHPYTRALLSAIPSPGRRRLRVLLEGSAPDPANPPSGCAFHPRCPRAEIGTCDETAPTLLPLDDDDAHQVACHFPSLPEQDIRY